jgi:hypothetical protein
MLLKGVAEAIEHCTQAVATAIYALEMVASAKARPTFHTGLCRATSNGPLMRNLS